MPAPTSLLVSCSSSQAALSCRYRAAIGSSFTNTVASYVAMHTMQDGDHDHGIANGTSQNGYADPYQQQTPKVEQSSLLEALATVGGMLLPLVTQIGHAH